MTTILCDVVHGLMAADSYQEQDSRWIDVGPKIASLECGLVAHAGYHDIGLLWRAWLEQGALAADRPALPDFGGLQLDRKGQLWVYTSACVPMPLTHPWYALGSGSDYAMAALYCGRSILEALRVTTHFNVYTRPPFIVYSLKDPDPMIYEA